MDELDGVTRFTLFMVGRTPVTIGSLVAALLVVVIAFILARFVGHGLRRVRTKAHNGASLYIVEKLATYGLVIAGMVAGVNMLGINLTSLAVFAGALGVGVGLGLQGVVKEFVSGLVLIFEGSVQVGDYIELDGGGRGEVKEVGPRATRIRNNDNVDILLPNSKLIEERVTTWTHKGATRRIHIPFSVAYGSDKNLVREAVLEAARSVPFTTADTDDRKSQVWLVGFGDSALNFELLVWPELSAVKRPAAVQAAYNWAIEDALGKHGIEIPFPQLDLRIRSLPPQEPGEATPTVRSEGKQVSEPSSGPQARNDAVEDLTASIQRDQQASAESSGEGPEANDQKRPQDEDQ